MSFSEIWPVLLFIIIFVAVIAFFILMTILERRRFAERSARLEQQSMERGWQFSSSRDGNTTSYNFSGKADDVSWHLESYYHHSSSRRGSSSSVRYTRWWTESPALSGEAVLVAPKGASIFQAVGSASALRSAPGVLASLASSMIQMALRLMVTEVLHAAPEDAQVFETIQQVQAGSEALRQQYMVLATSEMTAHRFLDEDAERMLLELVTPESSGQQLRIMGVVYWPRGIQFIAEGQIVEIDRLEQLVRLGMALVSGQTSSVWS